MGERQARQGGERAHPIMRQLCYATGEGEAEENRAHISEICCTNARTSRIPKKDCIPRKIF